MIVRNIKKWFLPTHWVYLLTHGIVLLFGIVLIIVGPNTFITAVGTSIVAAGITGWVVYVYILFTQRVSQQLSLLTRFGFSDAFEGRSVRIREEYDRRINKAHESIDIMGFGLRALREDYLPYFSNWVQKANVRILLIDPDFPHKSYAYAKQRDKEELNRDDTINRDVLEFLDKTKELRESTGGNRFEIHLYQCLPSINIFRIDDELFWGPYLIKDQSRNCPTFLVQRGGILYDRYLNHFNEIWNDTDFSCKP